MSEKEHKQYLKEFKSWSKEVTSTEESAQKFLTRSGINTRSGNLTKAYTSSGTKK